MEHAADDPRHADPSGTLLRGDALGYGRSGGRVGSRASHLCAATLPVRRTARDRAVAGGICEGVVARRRGDTGDGGGRAGVALGHPGGMAGKRASRHAGAHGRRGLRRDAVPRPPPARAGAVGARARVAGLTGSAHQAKPAQRFDHEGRRVAPAPDLFAIMRTPETAEVAYRRESRGTRPVEVEGPRRASEPQVEVIEDRKSTRLNSSHITTSYAVVYLK